MHATNGPTASQESAITLDVAPRLSALHSRVGAQRLSPLGGTDEQPRSIEVLRVSARSRPSAVAGAIAGVLRQRISVEVQSIGAGATNQAIKAVAIACTYLRDEDVGIACVPSFIDVMIDGEERTALRLLVERHPR